MKFMTEYLTKNLYYESDALSKRDQRRETCEFYNEKLVLYIMFLSIRYDLCQYNGMR